MGNATYHEGFPQRGSTPRKKPEPVPQTPEDVKKEARKRKKAKDLGQTILDRMTNPPNIYIVERVAKENHYRTNPPEDARFRLRTLLLLINLIKKRTDNPPPHWRPKDWTAERDMLDRLMADRDALTAWMKKEGIDVEQEVDPLERMKNLLNAYHYCWQTMKTFRHAPILRKGPDELGYDEVQVKLYADEWNYVLDAVRAVEIAREELG